jgi:hypothetical protein
MNRGDARESRRILDELACRQFAQDGPGLPGRALWLQSFRDWIPQLVDHELGQWGTWKPRFLEARFQLPLDKLVIWLEENDPSGKSLDLSDDERTIVLEGAIDRVDLATDGQSCRVLDYKTGTLPAGKQVENLKDLQLLLYSLAVECAAMIEAPEPLLAAQATYYGISAKQIGAPDKATWPGERDWLVGAARELGKLAMEAAAPKGPYPLLREERAGEGPAALPCRFCDFRGTCRLEERQGLPSETLVKIDKLVGQKEGGLF